MSVIYIGSPIVPSLSFASYPVTISTEAPMVVTGADASKKYIMFDLAETNTYATPCGTYKSSTLVGTNKTFTIRAPTESGFIEYTILCAENKVYVSNTTANFPFVPLAPQNIIFKTTQAVTFESFQMNLISTNSRMCYITLNTSISSNVCGFNEVYETRNALVARYRLSDIPIDEPYIIIRRNKSSPTYAVGNDTSGFSALCFAGEEQEFYGTGTMTIHAKNQTIDFNINEQTFTNTASSSVIIPTDSLTADLDLYNEDREFPDGMSEFKILCYTQDTA